MKPGSWPARRTLGWAAAFSMSLVRATGRDPAVFFKAMVANRYDGLDSDPVAALHPDSVERKQYIASTSRLPSPWVPSSGWFEHSSQTVVSCGHARPTPPPNPSLVSEIASFFMSPALTSHGSDAIIIGHYIEDFIGQVVGDKDAPFFIAMCLAKMA